MLEKIEKLNIETSKLRSDGTYGMFVLEPLQSGYGNTLGNSLRRVLLSREKGAQESPRLRSNKSPSEAFKRQSGLR